MKTLSKVIVISITVAGLCLLAGCNTMEGFGEDLQQVGGEIDEAADR